MARLSKRAKVIGERLAEPQMRAVEEAFKLLKEVSAVKFDETVDVSINLGIDARKSDQAVRGATVLPNGTGKTVRVAVFAQGENVEAAKEAGADIVGLEDLAEQIQGGNLDFNVVIATPDTMSIVGKLGPVLGPRGLMPNPKVGTVTPDVATAVKNAKSGQVRYRTDKGGVVHCAIGKLSFEPAALKENLETLLKDLVKAKPSSSKGVYLKKVTVTSTMGPGIIVDKTSLAAAA